MDKQKLKRLFSDLCCSECKCDFDEDSIQIVRKEDCLYVVQVVCQHCGKSFGLAFLGLESITLKPEDVEEAYVPLKITEGPEPISADDVLDAHSFIKNLEADWQKFIPEDFKD